MKNILYNYMSTKFKKAKLKKTVILEPKDLHVNYRDKIVYNLKKNLEGKCIPREGYIKKNSIEVISISVGKLDSSDFSGNVMFDVVFTCEITIPIQDIVLSCLVRQKNKIGLTASPLTTNAYMENIPYTILILKKIRIQWHIT